MAPACQASLRSPAAPGRALEEARQIMADRGMRLPKAYEPR